MKRNFLLSVIVHLLFLMTVICLVHRRRLDRPVPPPIVVTLKTAPAAGSSRSGGDASQLRSGNRREQYSRVPDLKSLGLPFRARDGASHSKGGDGANQSDERGDGYAIANAMGLEQEGKIYPFFDAIWKKVDAFTTYPGDFVDQGIQGRVTVQLVVDQRGVFTGEIKALNGEEPMLNAFVLSTLVHALRSPLPQAQWMKEPRMLLVFQFEFHLIGYGALPKPPEFAHLKNVLAFRRDAHVDPALNRAINRFLTRYLPPIIPIPGGFYIDFPRAYLYVKNLIHPSPDQDELRGRRLDQMKEELERFVRESSSQGADGRESAQ